MKNKANHLTLALLLLLLLKTHSTTAQTNIETYIRQGLESNEGVKQQTFLLEKNVWALREAKSMFLPEVDFATTYTRGEGGRTIDFPTGDLLNGVYSSLNQLTGTNAFPQLSNQSIQLFPNDFYDARFRTSMPILNAELIYNKRIKTRQVDLQQAEVQLYKRELVKDIKVSYYNYLKAVNAVRIYESSLRLVKEGERINTSLFDNGKVNRTAVVRSKNEVSKIEASLTVARNTRESAKAYFNFLLNRPATDSISVDEIEQLPLASLSTDDAIAGREELSKLKLAIEVNHSLEGLAKSYFIPKVGTYLDLGSQAFEWEFDKQSKYYFWGVSLNWTVFSSGKNTAKIRQAQFDGQALQSQTEYVRKQLVTELQVRQNELQSRMAEYAAAKSRMKTSQTYYDDTVKLYKEGMAIYIELLDAQNQWIEARQNLNIALFDAWIASSAVERANATFNIQP